MPQAPSSGASFDDIDLSPDGSKLAILLRDPDLKVLEGPDVQMRETRHLKLRGTLSTGDAPGGLIFAGESEIVTVQRMGRR